MALNQRRTNAVQNNLKTLFNATLAVIYLVLGLFFLLGGKEATKLVGGNPTYQYLFGGATVLYGLFRGYRAFLMWKEGKRAQQEQ